MSIATNNREDAAPICNLEALGPTDRAAHATNAERFLCRVEAIRETSSGFALGIPRSADMLARAGRFMAMEGICCPFLRFALTACGGQEPAWLEVSGDGRSKEYLREQMVAPILDARPDLELDGVGTR